MLAHQRRYVLVSMLFIAEIAAYLAALVFHVPTWAPSGIVTLLGTFVIAAIAGYGISALQQFQRIQEELRQRQSCRSGITGRNGICCWPVAYMIPRRVA